MKKLFGKQWLLILGAALLAPVALLAQPGEKDVKQKHKKDKEHIIITRQGGDEKIIVEVNGDKVTVNGKPIEEYKGDNVKVGKHQDSWSFGDTGQNWGMLDNFDMTRVDSNRAMLGVTTDKTDKGVEIQNITKESAAAKAGLKEGDVIKKINDSKIEDPDDLSKAIKSYKPGEKVSITYNRDNKELKTTAELGRWKSANVFSTKPGQYKVDLGDMNMDKVMPRIQGIPRDQFRYNDAYAFGAGKPKLGLSVQDTEDGKGVKVIEVDDDSHAEKAGIKNDDVITEVEGKAVNSADEVAKIIKDSKDKTSVMVKLKRANKTHNIEVKIPRKLKTADL